VVKPEYGEVYRLRYPGDPDEPIVMFIAMTEIKGLTSPATTDVRWAYVIRLDRQARSPSGYRFAYWDWEQL